MKISGGESKVQNCFSYKVCFFLFSFCHSHYTDNQFGITDSAQAAVYMSPPGMMNTMSPHSVACSDDMPITSASSSSSVADSNIDSFFAQHRDDLRDALDVVAEDIMQTHDMIRKKKAAVGQASSHKVTNSPSPANNIPLTVPQCSAPNIPVSAATQKRPEKLPIAPQRQPRSQQQPAAIRTGSVPVMVVSTAQSVSATTPVTSSQPVILMPPGQSTPVSTKKKKKNLKQSCLPVF